jgi:oxygen-dependent protoporphyrinogen oxidase
MSGHVVIVGGGITGLAALEYMTRMSPVTRVTLVEASSRLGGHIQTHRIRGYIMEGGPDVILTAKPAALELARRVGLGDRIQSTSRAVKGSYILTAHGLRRIPDGLTGLVPSRFRPFATTTLLSPFGKARVALDYAIPPRRDDDDESIERFVTRRLGREMYERLVEPLLSGISAGDGSRLSIGSMFPQLRAFERDHGSLIRGMLASRHKTNGNGHAPRADAPSPFASFPNGLQELVDAVARAVRQRDPRHEHHEIVLDAPVASIRRAERAALKSGAPRYIVELFGGRVLTADAIIVATPAHAASTLVEAIDPLLADMLRDIEYASMVTMSLAYRSEDVPRPLDATGYVVPRVMGRPVLACTWASAKFDGRAPADHVQFRLFIGGAGRGDHVRSSDVELRALAAAELREVMGVTADPSLVRIDRFTRAMPQYTVGHAARMARIASRVACLPGIDLAGAVYGGIGIPDCVRSGVDAAQRALASAFVSTSPSLAAIS